MKSFTQNNLPFETKPRQLTSKWKIAWILAPAAWLLLEFVGQWAALSLIDAGTKVHYQHYRPFKTLLETYPFPLALLVIQGLLVAWAFINRWPRIRSWLRGQFKPLQLLGIALVFFASAATVQRVIPLYINDLIFAGFVQLINLGNIVLVVWALPEESLTNLRQKIDKYLGNEAHATPGKGIKPYIFVLTAAIWVTLLSSVLGLLSYEWHPHLEDEVAYLYHARTLAAGEIIMPAPPVPKAFELYLMDVRGDQWFASTPPGWPAVLALGVRLGIPGLVNPILAGINILLAFFLIQYLYDRQTAQLGVFFLSVSPWYIFLGMSFMTHMITLTCLLAAALGVEKARRTNQARWGWLAGLALGYSSLIRPLDGIIIAGAVGLWAIGIGGRRLTFPALAALAFGTLLVGALVLPYNQRLTGNPMAFPINVYLDRTFGPGKNDLGFGPNRGYGWPIQPFPGHSPLGALINSNLNTSSINTELFGWSTGSLLFIALMLFAGKLSKSDKLMIGLCLANFIPYFFYYFSGGPDFGARYWFLMLIPAVVFTVRGVQLLREKIAGAAGASGGARVLAAVILLSALSLTSFFPWRAVDKYHHYLGMRADIPRLAEDYAFGKSLVFIRGERSHPDYASAAIYNPLDWTANAPIYAWYRSPELSKQLVEAFPGRPVWIVDGPSITNGGYQVVAGPLKGQALGEWVNLASTRVH